jgi:hypothetical protein
LGGTDGPVNWNLEVFPFGIAMPKPGSLIVRKRKRDPRQFEKQTTNPKEKPEPRRLGSRISPIPRLEDSSEKQLPEQVFANPGSGLQLEILFPPTA